MYFNLSLYYRRQNPNKDSVKVKDSELIKKKYKLAYYCWKRFFKKIPNCLSMPPNNFNQFHFDKICNVHVWQMSAHPSMVKCQSDLLIFSWTVYLKNSISGTLYWKWIKLCVGSATKEQNGFMRIFCWWEQSIQRSWFRRSWNSF